MPIKTIPIANIKRTPELQPREKLATDRVKQYAEAMKAGDKFPAVTVFDIGDQFVLLTSGFHRVAAAELAGLPEVKANVKAGTYLDAQWDAAGSNIDQDTMGLYRRNKDKAQAVRIAIEAALQMDPRPSNVQIAKRCGVSEGMIRKAIGSLVNSEIVKNEDTPVSVVRGGTEYTMATANIGKPSTEPQPAADEPDEPDEQPEFALTSEPKPKRVTFNHTTEMVDWAQWTWNPVTGCKHTCDYCYARELTIRYPDMYPKKFEPDFHEHVLHAPAFTKLPQVALEETDPVLKCGWRNVFVCSMADLFGQWVPQEWIDSVFRACKANEQWNYLFLTKFPQRYVGQKFPPTAWVGTTVDTQIRVANAEKAFAKIKAPVKWLSCEPMLEPLKFKDIGVFDWVVIGGQSGGSTRIAKYPDPWWVIELAHAAKEAGCKVYFKENTFVGQRIEMKEYPDAMLTQK